MKSIVVLGLVFPIVFSALAWGDRTHTHVLPSTGINHKPARQPTTSSGWVHLVTAPNLGAFYAKKGSLQKTQSHYSVIGKFSNLRPPEVIIYRDVVAITDCYNEAGTLRSYSLNGSLINQYDFAFGAGNATSVIAETICKVGASL